MPYTNGTGQPHSVVRGDLSIGGVEGKGGKCRVAIRPDISYRDCNRY